jgi:ribosomal protein L33
MWANWGHIRSWSGWRHDNWQGDIIARGQYMWESFYRANCLKYARTDESQKANRILSGWFSTGEEPVNYMQAYITMWNYKNMPVNVKLQKYWSPKRLSHIYNPDCTSATYFLFHLFNYFALIMISTCLTPLHQTHYKVRCRGPNPLCLFIFSL